MISPDEPDVRKEIPAFTYLRAWQRHQEELQSAILRVLNSGCLILGNEVAGFETEFSQFIGAQHAVAVSSGTDALVLALRALGVGSGDEVITVANGPVPTVTAIRAVGAVPRLVDVDARNLQMDPTRLAQCISSKTRCVIPVHLYGYPAPVKSILEVLTPHKIPVVEDCAQAHGTMCGERHAGTLGVIGCFSFYPTKNLGAFGDGGMCVTHDSGLAAKIREQAQYGFRGERVAYSDGLNCRLDELQAAVLRVRLKYLRENLQRRAAIAARYLSELAGSDVVLPAVPDDGRHAWHLFVLRSQDRSLWAEWLASRSIRTGVHYEHPVHRMPAFEWLGYPLGSLPNTEAACQTVLSLPMFPELTDEEVTAIIETIQAGLPCRPIPGIWID